MAVTSLSRFVYEEVRELYIGIAPNGLTTEIILAKTAESIVNISIVASLTTSKVKLLPYGSLITRKLFISPSLFLSDKMYIVEARSGGKLITKLLAVALSMFVK